MNKNRQSRGMSALTQYEFEKRGRAERVYQNTLSAEDRAAAVAEIQRIDGIPTTGWNTSIPKSIQDRVQREDPDHRGDLFDQPGN